MSNFNRRDFLKITGLAIGGSLLCNQTAQAETPPGNLDEAFAMMYDSTKCVGCNACTNACRSWNGTEDVTDVRGYYDAPYELDSDTWTMIQMYKEDNENYAFVKRQCMHCIDPGCVSGCPVSALEKTPEGPVVYNADRCIGCRYCQYTCPFHIPRFEWDERLPVVAKCTFCNDRLAVGDGPACAEICPTGAMSWGKRGDLLAEAEERLKNGGDRYINHIYGKDDAGGTSVLYLSAVPFEKLGLENLGSEPIPKLSEETGEILLPAITFGGPIALAAIWAVSKRGGWENGG
ncbi:MAG: hydrogenase 2 operon protein HybA [Anaerolineales bacterium]|jgi:formate dehydrogenase beta subunit